MSFLACILCAGVVDHINRLRVLLIDAHRRLSLGISNSMRVALDQIMSPRISNSALSLLSLVCCIIGMANASLSGSGYILPLSGTASTTQFFMGPELTEGTSCGVKAWANGLNAGTPAIGEGPGFLYAAANQLMFGANPTGEFSNRKPVIVSH